MYILQCKAGYPIPITTGGDDYEVRKEIVGVVATVNDTTAASRITLVDDYGKLGTDASTDVTICDLKGLANSDGVIGCIFPEVLKVRKGIAATNITNLVQGSILVYCR